MTTAEHPGHLVVTGPLVGRIPIQHDQHPEGWIDVSPDVVLCVDDDHAAAVCQAIDDEHRFRGTHPDQGTAPEVASDVPAATTEESAP